ncbi:MAG: D-alanyl-D-alanine carboxypeptidase [Treponema sp.]|nr:D-alanyl-D-alanine carboxypeptidase [Treponema sp.]
MFLSLAIPCFTTEFDSPLFPAAQPPLVATRSAVLLDAETGTVLFSQNPSLVISPASLTKLMTIHLALRAIRTGKASENDIVALPPESWAENQPPRSSLMFLGRNQKVTLGELLLGMAVSSGNDAAVATALHLAPTMEAFVAMMNAEAGRLGLPSTRFTEPAGIAPENTTTAMDYAIFCKTYVHEHPESLTLLHSISTFAYPRAINTAPDLPRTIVQNNRNALLNRVSGVNGLKTGYIQEAGFNIALSAHRGEIKLIAILLGASNEEERDRDSEALLNWGFENFKILHPVADLLPTVRIWSGKEKYAALRITEDLRFTVSSRRAGIILIETELTPYLTAPLAEGTQCGELIISDEIGELRRIPLVLEKEAAKGNFFQVFIDSIRLFFQRHFGKK